MLISISIKVCACKSGRHEEAIISFNKNIDLDSGNSQTLYYKGLSLSAVGRRKDAIDIFDQVLQILPGSVETWLQRGIAQADLAGIMMRLNHT